MALIDVVKRVAQQTNEASTPMIIMFGIVEVVNPIRILVDNRFRIEGEMVIVPKELIIRTEDLTHNHTVPQNTTETSEAHTHVVPQNETQNKLGVLVIREGLTVGDKVILLRNYGGQEFLVLGRM